MHCLRARIRRCCRYAIRYALLILLMPCHVIMLQQPMRVTLKRLLLAAVTLLASLRHMPLLDVSWLFDAPAFDAAMLRCCLCYERMPMRRSAMMLMLMLMMLRCCASAALFLRASAAASAPFMPMPFSAPPRAAAAFADADSHDAVTLTLLRDTLDIDLIRCHAFVDAY